MNRPLVSHTPCFTYLWSNILSTKRATRAPKELNDTGKKLWNRVLRDFELADHEELVLLQACRIADNLDRLQLEMTGTSLVIDSSQGSRIHPALVEARQQSLALAKVMASLRIPFGDEDAQPQKRSGVRGASLSSER
jgi:hypothetical protein